VLAVIGAGDGLSLTLAWAYVALRVVHSLVQVLSNRVLVRFLVFALASLTLIGLVISAALLVF